MIKSKTNIFYLRKQLILKAIVTFTILLLLICFAIWQINVRAKKQEVKRIYTRVMVLGIDAMDYGIVKKMIDKGQLPNLALLGKQGTFRPLSTTMPPLSPVAWTSFITGMNPGGHGVFDFLKCEVNTKENKVFLHDSVSHFEKANKKERKIPFTDYVLPSEQKQVLSRKGVPFWDILADHGVETVIYKIPANYPVSESQARILSGMGTPDIEGTYGAFTYVTNDEDIINKQINGGRIFKVKEEQGVMLVVNDDDTITVPFIKGPDNPFTSNHKTKTNLSIPFAISVDNDQKTAAISIQGQELLLKEKEWSQWVELEFELIPYLKSVYGNIRFYLKHAGEKFGLFISPVNLASGSYGLASGDLDKELNDECGTFYTKGMSEQTKALSQGIFSVEEYVEQSNLVYDERIKALEYLMSQFKQGFMFYYFSTLDLDSHMMWKYREDKRDKHNYAAHIENRYKMMDRLIGDVRGKLGQKDVLYVISDHGFASFDREFNMCRWLEQEGYLVYESFIKARTSQMYSGVDWGKTKAYGNGFNGLLINRVGMSDSDYENLVEDIRQRLLEVEDDDGTKIFKSVYRPDEIYTGQLINHAPDLILGYQKGYGPSDDSVQGTWSEYIVDDHVDGFSGHHVCDHKAVPGVFLSNEKMSARQIRLEDVTVLILNKFGLSPTANMTGVSLN